MVQEVMNAPSGGPDAPGQPAELEPVAQVPAGCSPTQKSPFLTRGNLMLIGMLAAGVVGVWVLSLRNGPSSALADQQLVHTRVEVALQVLGDGPTEADAQRRSNARAIVREFYTAAKQRQVPVKQLKGNPFVFESAAPPEKNTAPKEPPKPKIDPLDVERDRALEAVKGLHVIGILAGDPPTASITGAGNVRVGDRVVGWKVTRIDRRTVEVHWSNAKHKLDRTLEISK